MMTRVFNQKHPVGTPQNVVKAAIAREYQVQYWLLWTLLHIAIQPGVNYNIVSSDFDVKV